MNFPDADPNKGVFQDFLEILKQSCSNIGQYFVLGRRGNMVFMCNKYTFNCKFFFTKLLNLNSKLIF
jgi:hypothetical protein